MAKTVAEEIAAFSVALDYERIPDLVLRKCKDLVLDGIGCALGGVHSEPARIVREVMDALGGVRESTVIGSKQRLPVTAAALVNGVMLRYLDFNDTDYGTKTGGHHSEILPCALAVGERQRASGRDLLEAVVIGYEIQCAFTDSIDLFSAGLHGVTLGAVAAPAVAGKLLKLDAERVANAIGLSCTTGLVLNSWLRETEEIPMIKAYGYPSTAEVGIRAALLAQRGFTAPVDAVETLFSVFGRDSDPTPIRKLGDSYRLLRQILKAFPSQMFTQAPIEAAVTLVKLHQIIADEVEEVLVKTAPVFVNMQTSAVAYNPKTRESADHSTPYTVAMAIIDGTVTPDQYARQQWNDPAVKSLMKKIKCQTDEALSNAVESHPVLSAEVSIRTRDGHSYTQLVKHPRGHPNNPMSPDELEAKFRSLANPVLPDAQQGLVIETVRNLESLLDISGLMSLLACQGSSD